MRLFRADRLSAFVSEVISGDQLAAFEIYSSLSGRYLIHVTRDFRGCTRMVAKVF